MIENIQAIYKNGVLHPLKPLDLPEDRIINLDVRDDANELEKQIAVCSDEEVLELAEIKMPTEKDERLSRLLDKQTEGNLSGDEQNELWQLMDLNRLTTLKKAYALREISQRGLDGEN